MWFHPHFFFQIYKATQHFVSNSSLRAYIKTDSVEHICHRFKKANCRPSTRSRGRVIATEDIMFVILMYTMLNQYKSYQHLIRCTNIIPSVREACPILHCWRSYTQEEVTTTFGFGIELSRNATSIGPVSLFHAATVFKWFSSGFFSPELFFVWRKSHGN